MLLLFHSIPYTNEFFSTQANNRLPVISSSSFPRGKLTPMSLEVLRVLITPLSACRLRTPLGWATFPTCLIAKPMPRASTFSSKLWLPTSFQAVQSCHCPCPLPLALKTEQKRQEEWAPEPIAAAVPETPLGSLLKQLLIQKNVI